MIKDAATLSYPGWAWFYRSCLAGIVVGWLVLLRVRAWARADQRFRLLSCPGSAAAAAAVAAAAEQLGAALGSGAASAARSKKEQLGGPLQQQLEQQQ